MAYIFKWRLHGNRVSKTRFISLINMNKSERNHQNNREEPRREKKKKKQKGREDRDWRSELVASNHCARPRQTQAARDPSLRLTRLGLPRSPRLESFSPPLIWVFRIGIDVFFLYLFLGISACTWDFNFFGLEIES